MKSIDSFLYSDCLIIIFAREPVFGQVKTRLIPSLGENGATQLYIRLLEHAIANVTQSNLCPLEICITPESHENYFLDKLGNKFNITRQDKGHLGQRMYHAINVALKKYNKVILIGSDCPFLSQNDLQQAIIALKSNDMVFSPAIDGGYVLVGANKINAEVFKNIEWGSEHVMRQTQEILLAHDISYKELYEQHDIDIVEDLKYLPQSFLK